MPDRDMARVGRQMRTIETKFEVRDSESGEMTIEGYFAVFGETYDLNDWMSESIDKHAFDGALGDDIRALTNHETTLVLGRTTNGTLTLSVDEHGLRGRIKINPKDSDAVNLYERVKRGDVNQCSFGFDILDEEPITRMDGGYHWLIKKVKLWEVSCCTFPAYESTAIEARSADAEKLKARETKTWRMRMEDSHKWLKGENE